MKKKFSNEICYGVIGLGRFGLALAAELAASGAEVMVVDREESRVRAAREFTDQAFVTDDLSQENLQAMGFANCGTVAVCIGDKIDISLLAALNSLNLGVSRVVAKALSPEHAELLEKIGAEAVRPERDMGIRLAKKLRASTVMEYIRLTDDFDIAEYQVPSSLVGVTVENSGIRRRFHLNIIAIQTGEQAVTVIDPAHVFTEEEHFVLIGSPEELRRFERAMWPKLG